MEEISTEPLEDSEANKLKIEISMGLPTEGDLHSAVSSSSMLSFSLGFAHPSRGVTSTRFRSALNTEISITAAAGSEMKRFTAKIVDMMKQENPYALQGGPIILSQVENECGNIDEPYGPAANSYIK
ncbi:hypothetical protein VNO77_26872 [Canavalia gladiata]|uniref:Glycoside hydrolase 35 catalytic domain-containing protein n=1 Tax=Canavalia gladiata TaxID=3824 RepID=A0AAN9KT14_CANGL